MLHSKVYYFEMGDGSASAFIGSHNVTGFALRGLNGEAGVFIEGPATDPVFSDIRHHVDEAYRQAVQYDPSMKEAFTWWTREYFAGLRAEANDAPKESEAKRTILMLAAQATGPIPKPAEIIYFEIAEALREIRSLDTDVHLYLFDKLPASPSEALSQLTSATTCLSCQVVGLEVGSGGVELSADWSIDDGRRPDLIKTKSPFRPKTTSGMQQVRVEVRDPLEVQFDYLFDAGKDTWAPVLDDNEETSVTDDDAGTWQHVKALAEVHIEGSEKLQMALREASPESGSFILYSRRRRKLS